ncbi:MAG TPA: flagellar assembly protein FliW [Firmicutes bacterium]|nr:flagellar assembly protein FliW [Bacillota bacterium]
MDIQTKFYGSVSFQENELINFPEGLPGFEDCHRFLLLQPEGSVFRCLQSVDNPAVAFVTVSPHLFYPEYSIDLPEESVQALGLKSPEDAVVLGIATIREKLEDSTINLQAPIVINKESRLGRQEILPDSGYAIRCPLWKKDDVKKFQCS